MGGPNAVIRKDLLGQRFVVRQQQPSRIAARVMLPHQFEIADDMMVVNSHAMELFEQIEGDVGLEIPDCSTNIAQVVTDSQRQDLVSNIPQRVTTSNSVFQFRISSSE